MDTRYMSWLQTLIAPTGDANLILYNSIHDYNLIVLNSFSACWFCFYSIASFTFMWYSCFIIIYDEKHYRARPHGDSTFPSSLLQASLILNFLSYVIYGKRKRERGKRKIWNRPESFICKALWLHSSFDMFILGLYYNSDYA